MRTFLAGAFAFAIMATTVAAQTPSPRTLRLEFHADRTVSLTASNVTVREILSEWARQCGCYIVNWDKLGGAPLAVPAQYTRETQGKVLESLLRQAAGYVLTPKRSTSTTLSNYETIYILASSSPTAGAYVAPAAPMPPSVPMPTAGSPEDEIPAVAVPPPPGGPGLPGRPGLPGVMPGTPGGVTPGPTVNRPGMPSVFVPIVPVGGSQTPPPVPGMPTTVPQAPAPVPIIALPPAQSR